MLFDLVVETGTLLRQHHRQRLTCLGRTKMLEAFDLTN